MEQEVSETSENKAKKCSKCFMFHLPLMTETSTFIIAWLFFGIKCPDFFDVEIRTGLCSIVEIVRVDVASLDVERSHEISYQKIESTKLCLPEVFAS